MNYYECEFHSLLRSSFFYIDTENNLADSIFKENGISVRYKKELSYAYTDYKIVFVSVYKQKDYLFIKSMYELYDKIKETGHEDYDDICDEIIAKVVKSKKKVKYV